MNTPSGKKDTALAFFAGGCFWGVEHFLHQHKGVLSAVSGYMGGHVSNPSYEQVCAGRTGHAEAVRVEYDPFMVSYEDLARYFFEIHDPTHLNRQGPDVGTQYRSAIFYVNQEQREIAERLVQKLRHRGWLVVTEILPAGEFYPAEDYHQEYFSRNPQRLGCHMRVHRFSRGPGRLFAGR